MPVIKEVSWGKDNPVDAVPVLTEDDKEVLRKKIEAMDKLLAEQGKAKYKIEVQFAHKRSLHGSSVGIMSLWESGTKLHGGGDTKVYFCPAKEQKTSDCEGLIPDASNGYGYLVCPKCQKVWQGEQVYGELVFRLDTWKWAEVLLKHYIKLGHNADIYCKFPKHDLRQLAKVEQNKQWMGEKLAKARKERDTYIYPLKNIVSDVSNGADLLVRFHAFLTA